MQCRQTTVLSGGGSQPPIEIPEMRLGGDDDDEERNRRENAATAYGGADSEQRTRRYLFLAAMLFLFLVLRSAGQRDYRADAENYLRSVGRGEARYCARKVREG